MILSLYDRVLVHFSFFLSPAWDNWLACFEALVSLSAISGHRCNLFRQASGVQPAPKG